MRRLSDGVNVLGTRGEERERGDVHKELINNGRERVHAEGTYDGRFRSHGEPSASAEGTQFKYEPENQLGEKTKSTF